VIDKERTMAEVHSLAEEARDNPVPPKNPGVIAPIYMGKDHEVIPERYVVHYSITRCANCKAESRDNEFYALSYLKSRVNGTRVRHLTRCARPLFNLPVDRIPTGIHSVPYCCECDVIDLSHLPPPPSAALVYDLAEPTAKNAKPKTAAKPAAAKPTLNDLI
jgi:hypothetical protein